MADRLADIADRLYALPQRDFVAERDAAAAQARADGDAATAAALAKLRRPSVAAWLVNLLALRRPELVAGLAELSTALHAAQRDLDGGALRELTAQRRSTVAALVAETRALALEVDAGFADGKLPLAEVERALHAALADQDVAEAVRSGRLTKAVGYEGFGELPRVRLRVVEGEATDDPGGGGAAAAVPDAKAHRRAAETELTQARAAAEAASAELERVNAEQRDVKQELAGIDAAMAELTARRTATMERLSGMDAAGLAARRAVVAARRRLGEAEAVAIEAGLELPAD